jgi:hypothetical protein
MPLVIDIFRINSIKKEVNNYPWVLAKKLRI